MEELGDLIADRPISQLVLPGSHDAGATSAVGCTGALCTSAQNQDRKIYHQLERGSRYLDLRFAWNCTLNDYGTYHNKWPFQYPMREILLEEIPDFIGENPKELIILNIGTSHGFREAEPDQCEGTQTFPAVQANFAAKFAEVCETFNVEYAHEFLRPSRVLRSPYIEGPGGNRFEILTEESAATRAAIMGWDTDPQTISVTRSEGTAAGLLAGTTTMQDIWDLAGPQLIVMWPACTEHLTNNQIPNHMGDWAESSSSAVGASGQRSGAPREDGVFVPSDYSKYYANWCNNNDNLMWNGIERAITGRDGDHRLAGNRSTFTGEAFGLYNASLATTFVEEGSILCPDGPRDGFDDQEEIALALEDRYYEEPDGAALRANVNIIEGDFIEDSVIPEVAILTNAWAGHPNYIDIQLSVAGSGSERTVTLDCSGSFATTGQLLQVPEPYARIDGLDPSTWYELLEPLSDQRLSWLTYPQFRVMAPVPVDPVTRRAQIQTASESAISGAPPTSRYTPQRFPGRQFDPAPVFRFSGKRTETFVGICSDRFGFSVRETLSVELPDVSPPAISVQGCVQGPSESYSADCDESYVAGTWVRDTVVLNPQCSDDSRGVICPSPVSYSEHGTHQPPSFTATDVANNSAHADFGEVRIDKVAPTVTVSLTNDAGAYISGTWSNSAVTAQATCEDADSDIEFCSGDQVFNEGEASYTATATDNAGNTAAANALQISVDTTIPTIAASATTSNSADYTAGQWTNQAVTVSFTCNDNLSGVAACASPGTRADEGDDQSVAGTVTDNAGNQNSISFQPIRIDLTPPELSASASTSDGDAYQFGDWINQLVTVSYQCSDLLSGVDPADCPAPVTIGSEGADQSVAAITHDRAGNESSFSASVSLDTTPPAISAAATTADGNAYQPGDWVNGSINVTYQCLDQLSGVDPSDCPAPVTIDGEGGNQSVTGTAYDRAGNSSATTTQPLNIDLTEPLVSYDPASANYSILDHIDIRCTASDAVSFVQEDSCVSIDAPASDFEPGEHELAASATDAAGNVGQGAMRFSITANHADLCTMTRERMSAFPDTADDLCNLLDKAAEFEYRNMDAMHDERMGRFQLDVETALEDGEITAADADLLIRIAQAMIDVFTPDPSAEGRVHGSGYWARGAHGGNGKIDFSFDAQFQGGELRGKLQLHDKESGNGYRVTIDGDRITSLSDGAGMDCGGLVLDGIDSFAFTAQGQFSDNGQEGTGEFLACGIDYGRGNDEPADYLFVRCTDGCTYASTDRVAQSEIAGGNIHLHDAIYSGDGYMAVSSRENTTAPGSTGRLSAARGQKTRGSGTSEGTASNRSAIGEVDVIALDPILQATVPDGSPFVLVAVLELTDGLATAEPVVLRWITDTGLEGETSALTEALGIATFTVTVPAGDIEFVAHAGGIDSNGVRVTGTAVPFHSGAQ